MTTIHSVVVDEYGGETPVSVDVPNKLEAVRYPHGDLLHGTMPWEWRQNKGYLLAAQKKMEKYLRAHGENALGIAANQCEVPYSMFSYWDDYGDIRTLVNPEIVESSGQFQFKEGCLSIPGLSFNLIRPNKVLLVADDMDGNEVEIEAEGVLGRLFQHECDHLNGLLVWDRLDTHKRQVAKRKFKKNLTATL